MNVYGIKCLLKYTFPNDKHILFLGEKHNATSSSKCIKSASNPTSILMILYNISKLYEKPLLTMEGYSYSEENIAHFRNWMKGRKYSDTEGLLEYIEHIRENPRQLLLERFDVQQSDLRFGTVTDTGKDHVYSLTIIFYLIMMTKHYKHLVKIISYVFCRCQRPSKDIVTECNTVFDWTENKQEKALMRTIFGGEVDKLTIYKKLRHFLGLYRNNIYHIYKHCANDVNPNDLLKKECLSWATQLFVTFRITTNQKELSDKIDYENLKDAKTMISSILKGCDETCDVDGPTLFDYLTIATVRFLDVYNMTFLLKYVLGKKGPAYAITVNGNTHLEESALLFKDMLKHLRKVGISECLEGTQRMICKNENGCIVFPEDIPEFQLLPEIKDKSKELNGMDMAKYNDLYILYEARMMKE